MLYQTLKNEKGVSLLQVIAIAALVAILSYVSVSFWTSYHRNVVRTQDRTQYKSLAEVKALHFSDPKSATDSEWLKSTEAL